jgi:peptidoglycan/LPS O-acetylase OafA/YrhL
MDISVVRAGAWALEVVGACLAVVLALHWAPVRRVLSAPWAQWLGVRSFSLYLVHEPLAVTSAALVPGMPILVRVLVVVGVSLLVAHNFHRAVEYPAHRLSRAVARRYS